MKSKMLGVFVVIINAVANLIPPYNFFWNAITSAGITVGLILILCGKKQ